MEILISLPFRTTSNKFRKYFYKEKYHAGNREIGPIRERQPTNGNNRAEERKRFHLPGIQVICKKSAVEN